MAGEAPLSLPQAAEVNRFLGTLANQFVNDDPAQGTKLEYYQTQLEHDANLHYRGDIEQARAKFRGDLLRDTENGIFVGDASTAARILIAGVGADIGFEIFEGRLKRSLNSARSLRRTAGEDKEERAIAEEFVVSDLESLNAFRRLAGRGPVTE